MFQMTVSQLCFRSRKVRNKFSALNNTRFRSLTGDMSTEPVTWLEAVEVTWVAVVVTSDEKLYFLGIAGPDNVLSVVPLVVTAEGAADNDSRLGSGADICRLTWVVSSTLLVVDIDVDGAIDIAVLASGSMLCLCLYDGGDNVNARICFSYDCFILAIRSVHSRSMFAISRLRAVSFCWLYNCNIRSICVCCSAIAASRSASWSSSLNTSEYEKWKEIRIHKERKTERHNEWMKGERERERENSDIETTKW